MNPTKEQLKERGDKLPETLRQYLVSPEWENQLRDIFLPQNLTGEQEKEIANEVFMVLLGITDPDDLSLAIRTVAELSENESEELARAINEKIFKIVENELSELDPVTIEDYAFYQNLSPEIREALEKLPATSREIFLSNKIMENIQGVGEKYRLPTDQINNLDQIISRTLLGLEPVEKFADSLEKGLEIDRPMAEEITREVSEKIFSPLQTELQKLSPGEEKLEATESFSEIPEKSAPTVKLDAALETVDISAAVKNVGNEFRLHVDQMGALENEVRLVIEGKTSPEDFLAHLKERLGLGPAVAETIAQEINKQIFLPVRQALQQGSQINEKPEDLPNKDKLLDEIEHPKNKEDTVFEKKLGTLFRIPREEVDLDLADPYREKLE